MFRSIKTELNRTFSWELALKFININTQKGGCCWQKVAFFKTLFARLSFNCILLVIQSLRKMITLLLYQLLQESNKFHMHFSLKQLYQWLRETESFCWNKSILGLNQYFLQLSRTIIRLYSFSNLETHFL